MFWTNQNIQESIDPFRYWIVDDFLPQQAADSLYFNFPEPDDDWYRYENHFEVKRATDRWDKIPIEHWMVLAGMNTCAFTAPLEKITGISGIIPDPYFRGGGLHWIKETGKLDIHADFNVHKHLNLDRRLNVLLYLNKGYQKEWGGELELWDKEMKTCVKRIEPIFNRLVIFETTDFSFHGHPDPWRGTSPRRSMAWYFYTNGRPDHEKSAPHSTKFQKRPNEETNLEIEALREKRNMGRL